MSGTEQLIRCPRRRAVCDVLTAILVTGVFLAPPPMITDCSDVQYRQEHLAECNLPPELRSHGGKGGGGLLGDLLGAIGLGGLL